MSNFLGQLALPGYSSATDQIALLEKAMREYGQLYAAYQNQVNDEARSANDRTIENLAREGKLTGSTLAQAHAVTNTWRASELSKAQLGMGMQQAAGNQQREELKSQRSQALTSDLFNLGKFAAGAALTAGGVGAFSKPATAATATPGLVEPAAPTAVATANAARLNPSLTAVGENLMGLQGQPFTGQAMRQKYPDLYQQPQFPANYANTDEFSQWLWKMYQQYSGQPQQQ